MMKCRICFKLPLLLLDQTFLEEHIFVGTKKSVSKTFFEGIFWGCKHHRRRSKHYWWGEAFPGAQLSCAGDPPISPWLLNIIFVIFCLCVCVFVCLFICLFVCLLYTNPTTGAQYICSTQHINFKSHSKQI